MMNSDLEVRENIMIADLTTMRLGGEARYVMVAKKPEDIQAIYKYAKKQALPVWVMGGGANTIGKDGGFNGIIILNRIQGIYLCEADETIELNQARQKIGERDEAVFEVMAGEIWDDFVEICCELGFSGIEAMSKIPGRVGAAPVQNIGAYGQDMASVIESVKAYDTLNNEFVELDKSELEMGYRHTRFNYGKDKGRFVITSVKLKLEKGQMQQPFYNSLQRYIDEHHETDFSPKNIRRMVSIIREEKLPDPEKIASSGSFFKNVYLDKNAADEAENKGIPVWRDENGKGKINSGWLIEQCGLKGVELFGFEVSEKAALVLINKTAKSYHDLEKARSKIINEVYQKFGYKLEQEPVEIGVEK